MKLRTLTLLMLLLLTFSVQFAQAEPPKPNLKTPGWKLQSDHWNLLNPSLSWKSPPMMYNIEWATRGQKYFEAKIKGTSPGSDPKTSLWLSDWTETTVQGKKAWQAERTTKSTQASSYEKVYFVVEEEAAPGKFKGYDITFVYSRPGSSFIRKNPKSLTLQKLLDQTTFPK